MYIVSARNKQLLYIQIQSLFILQRLRNKVLTTYSNRASCWRKPEYPEETDLSDLANLALPQSDEILFCTGSIHFILFYRKIERCSWTWNQPKLYFLQRSLQAGILCLLNDVDVWKTPSIVHRGRNFVDIVLCQRGPGSAVLGKVDIFNCV